MSFLRSGRCPSCHSDKVTVVAPGNLKLIFGLNLTLGFIIASFVVGFGLRRMAVHMTNLRDIATGVFYWNILLMLPLGLLLVPLYFILTRVESKKRVCRDCGKKWKVRHRNREKTEKTPVPRPSSQPS